MCYTYRVYILTKECGKMKKILLLAVFFSIAGGFIFAGDTGASVWKPGVASNTYGIVLLPITITDAKGNSQTVYLPGVDIRLFTGKNVTKRGGFYTGVETGALVFPLSLDDQLSSMTSSSDTQVSLSTDQFIASVFLLAKYGYRLDLGFKFFGISLGAEAGIGARIASGFFTLYGNDGTVEDSLDMGYDASYMSMMLDAAVEAAIRIGPNFRLVGKLGGMLTPPYIMSDAGHKNPEQGRRVTIR